MVGLILDLVNIIIEYLDIHNYAELIKLNSGKYSWKKYFKGKLPDIYESINIYDNLDLVKYIVAQDSPKLNYNIVNPKSILIAEYIIQKFPIGYQDSDDKEYESLIYNTLKSNNSEVFEYLLYLKKYYFGGKILRETKDANFETIKVLLKFAQDKLCIQDYKQTVDNLTFYVKSLTIKKYLQGLRC